MHEILFNPESWVAVAFVIGIVLMWWKGSHVLTSLLDDRAAKIAAELAEAQKLRDEAEKTLADYQKRQSEAFAEAQGIADRARADAERLAEKAARDLDQMLRRREELAHERIAQAEAAAIAEVRNVAIDVAIAATKRMMTEMLDKKSGARLIDDAIAELPKRLH